MLNNIYFHLPAFLQNIALSAYGLNLRLTRNGGIYKYMRDVLQDRWSWTESDFADYSKNQFNIMLKEAIARTRFYSSSKYSDYLCGHGSLQELPVLSKDTVKSAHSLFVNEKYNGRVVRLKTTGTTGSPLLVPCTPESRQINYAFFDDFLSFSGVDPKSRRAVFGGRPIINPKSISPPFWRKSYYQNTILFSSYHISNITIPSYIEELKKFKPSYIEAYPSAIYLLAKYMVTNGISLPCSAIITSSETLLPHQRSVLQEAFQCRVYDQYGSVEMSAFISQCKYGAYHVRQDYGYFELIGEDGCLVGENEEGRIVSTGFLNNLFPLIRYDLGDAAILGRSGCRCGLKTPIIKEIAGRRDDYILTPSGRKIGRVSPVLKGLPILESQFIQQSTNEVTVKVVAGEGANLEELEYGIKKAAHAYIGGDTHITVKFVDAIPRGEGGKFRSVISLI